MSITEIKHYYNLFQGWDHTFQLDSASRLTRSQLN